MSKMNVRRLKIFSRSLFVIYLIAALYLLFFSESMGRTIMTENYRYNLVLFKEINRFIAYRDTLGFTAVVTNLLGNVFCFVPFGLFLPTFTNKLRSIILIAILTFCFSLTIEIIQLLFKVGCFDVDDLLMNTIGGILGYLIFFFYHRIFIIRRKRL